MSTKPAHLDPLQVAITVPGVIGAVPGADPSQPLLARVATAVTRHLPVEGNTVSSKASLRLTVSADRPAHETAAAVADALRTASPADEQIIVQIARIT